VALADTARGHVYHRWLGAAAFVVYSAEAPALGLVRLDGQWSLAGDATAVGA